MTLDVSPNLFIQLYFTIKQEEVVVEAEEVAEAEDEEVKVEILEITMDLY